MPTEPSPLTPAPPEPSGASASSASRFRVVAVLGAGVMGSAVLSAMLSAGRGPEGAVVTTLDDDAARRWRAAGVDVVDNPEAARRADALLVAVKPGDVAAVLDEVAPQLRPGAVVVSLAAGVRLATLSAHLPEGTPTARVMPNTPALVGEGMLAMSPGEHCDDAVRAAVEDLLRPCGRVLSLPEKLQDAVTGLSGSGPAYVFYVAEALIEAGVVEGLPRPVATELAVQTLYGAAAMLRGGHGGQTHPSLLREQVTSPGGTTARGLRELDAGGVRAALGAAVAAATAASARLGG